MRRGLFFRTNEDVSEAMRRMNVLSATESPAVMRIFGFPVLIDSEVPLGVMWLEDGSGRRAALDLDGKALTVTEGA